jgi:hypothetical protein
MILPTPADTARDLLIAAAWLRAAGYPSAHLVGWAIELLGVPLPEDGLELSQQRRGPLG